MSIDDETLMAFADGELPEARAAEVARAVAADPALAARVERHRAVRRRLSGALDGLTPPADLMARARQAQGARTATRPRLWGSAIAASVAGLVVGAGLVMSLQAGDAGLGGDYRARGQLASGLDGTVSGSTRGSVSPLYTVAAADGRLCRAFRTPTDDGAYEGVACRDAKGWRVLALAATSAPSGGFTQASGDEPAAVTAALDALNPGEPLSPAAERALIERNWTSRE